MPSFGALTLDHHTLAIPNFLLYVGEASYKALANTHSLRNQRFLYEPSLMRARSSRLLHNALEPLGNDMMSR